MTAGPLFSVNSGPHRAPPETDPLLRTCEKIKQLTPRPQDAKTRKEELPCFLCAFGTFAPLREMLLLFGRFLHTFSGVGSASVYSRNGESTPHSHIPALWGPLLEFVLAFLRIFNTFFEFVLSSFGFVFSALLLMLKDLLGSFRIF